MVNEEKKKERKPIGKPAGMQLGGSIYDSTFVEQEDRDLLIKVLDNYLKHE